MLYAAQAWADSLRGTIDAAFFHADLGLWGTFTPGSLDRAPVRHFDLLGSSLAVASGVGSSLASIRGASGSADSSGIKPVRRW